MTGNIKLAKTLVNRFNKDKDMTDAKHENQHGKMDTDVQEKTFYGFISLVSKSAIVCILVLLFLALTNS